MDTHQIGFFLLVAGAVLVLRGKCFSWIGHLPGDFVYRGQHVQVFLPLGTCLALSLILTILARLFSK